MLTYSKEFIAKLLGDQSKSITVPGTRSVHESNEPVKDLGTRLRRLRQAVVEDGRANLDWDDIEKERL